MAIEKVKEYFKGFGIEDRIQEFEVSSATVALAAQALGCDEAETLIGHEVGGVCPFAVNGDVEVYLNVSLKRFETIIPACGSSDSAIELTKKELEKYS